MSDLGHEATSSHRRAYHPVVRSSLSINPTQFVEAVSPLIERRDVHGLIKTIHSRWTLGEVLTLLNSQSCDARKVSALVLSLVGTDACIQHLARQLHDEDPVVAQMAEHALWSIWLRGGNDIANGHMARGTAKLERQDLQGAVAAFTDAIRADPDFAEAYNQRAMAHYLLEQFPQCKADCQIAVTLMPHHFGAWSGLGHCHACLGEIDLAIKAYRRAKRINPHLACIDELIEELQASRNPQ